MKNYLSVIYQYYPRNLPWGTYAYQQSAEYRKYKETACRFQENPPLDFYDVLKKGLPHFSILDWCNFDLYPDREYKILLAPDQPYLDDDQALFQRLAGTVDELICICESVASRILSVGTAYLSNRRMVYFYQSGN